jgi:phosphoglycerol transferase
LKNNDDKNNRKTALLNMLIAALWCVFTIMIVTLFFAERYLMDNWSALSIEEIAFHLKSTLDGTNPEMVRDALLKYGLPAAAVVLIFLGTLYAMRKNKKTMKVYMSVVFVMEMIALFMVVRELDVKTGLIDYIRWSIIAPDKDFIAENFVEADDVEITFPSKKRNLIYIFLESTEMTYADRENGGAFEKNVIPELTALAQENECFSGEGNELNGGFSLSGSTWTTGAMFAMGTGAPLKVAINGNHIDSEENFFPGIASLGTILQKEGYKQELLIGSYAVFGGRDIFYKGHGDFEIRDYDYALKNGRIPSDYRVFWGYEDEKLFQFAKEDLEELSAGEEPFNLTMLTVDTHFEDGYHCRLCRDDFGEQYADAFACASRQVTEFVEWVQQQDFYENTTIVICGDHCTMDTDFCKNVPDDYPRRVYVAIINGKNPDEETWTSRHRDYSTMDLFPTTLAAMNVRIEGNRLGLGTNLYSEEETLIEKHGVSTCNSLVGRPSAFMDEMSGIEITEEILDQVRQTATAIETPSDDGKVLLKLHYMGKVINYRYIDKVELEITDRNTQKTEVYDNLELFFESDNDVNNYYYALNYDLKGRSMDDIDYVFYITMGDFEHYEVAGKPQE